MKTLYVSLLFAIILNPFISNAQANSDDSTALKSTPTLAFKKGDFTLSLHVGYISEPFTLGGTTTTGGEPIGINLGYALSDHITIGIEFGDLATSSKGSYTYPSTNGYTDVVAYSIQFTIIYYQADIRWHWIVKPNHSFYSSLSIGSNTLTSYEVRGTSFTESSPSVGGLTYQVIAIGWNRIGKHFGVNFELGYGINGIIDGGLEYRF